MVHSLWLNLIRKVREVSQQLWLCFISQLILLSVFSQFFSFCRVSRHPWPFRENAASLLASPTETPCLTPLVIKTQGRLRSEMALLLCHGLLNGEAPSEREARIQVCSQVICSYLTEIHCQNKSTAGETVSINVLVFKLQAADRGGPNVVFLWPHLIASQTVFATATAAMPGQWGQCVCWWEAQQQPLLWATSIPAPLPHLLLPEPQRSPTARGASLTTLQVLSMPVARMSIPHTSTALTLKETLTLMHLTVEDLLFSFH